jgi:hypothetical protein
MSNINTGGPAFPHTPENVLTSCPLNGGMTLRQYAAIKLKVPNSGTDWLDEMIVESNRNDLAAKAMNGILSRPDAGYLPDEQAAIQSYMMADAMPKAREQ